MPREKGQGKSAVFPPLPRACPLTSGSAFAKWRAGGSALTKMATRGNGKSLQILRRSCLRGGGGTSLRSAPAPSAVRPRGAMT